MVRNGVARSIMCCVSQHILITIVNCFMMDFLQARALIITAIRRYFQDRDFLETDTPSLVVSPGMEPHIRPMQVAHSTPDARVFLPTSPEFAMKRLLARGYPRIFQICKAYRLEPKSSTHNPEFSILEWYRAHSDYEAIMADVEGLFAAIARALRKAALRARSTRRKSNPGHDSRSKSASGALPGS